MNKKFPYKIVRKIDINNVTRVFLINKLIIKKMNLKNLVTFLI